MALFVLSFQISYLTKNCNSTFLQRYKNYLEELIVLKGALSELPSLTLQLKISDVQLPFLVPFFFFFGTFFGYL